MHKLLVSTGLVVLALVPFATLAAQEPGPPLEPGVRVRITAPDLGIERQEARFEALREGTLLLTTDSTVTCPVASVSRLEVHAGQKSHVWAGVVGGFLIGAGVGALVNSNNEGCLEILDESGCTWIGAGVGGLALGLVGAVVGSVIKTDRWEEVPLGQLRVSVVPQRDGLALGVTVSF